MVEIIDGVLEFLKHVFLPLELARHVGDRPHRQAGLALAVTERAHAHPQPAPGLVLAGAHAHLLLQATAFARCLEQAIDRLGDARIANEDPLDRAHVAGGRGIGERKIGSVGIDDAPTGIGDESAFAGAVDHRLDERACHLLARYAQDAGREREQQKHADGGQQGQ